MSGSGQGMSQGSPFPPTGLHPHIGPTGFTVGIFTVLGISILTIIARIILRIQRTRHLEIDDYILLVGLVLLIAGVAVQQHYRDLSYMVLNVELGNVMPTADFALSSPTEAKILDASSVLLWSSIFCVKFSFLFFFRKLINRVRNLQIYWWVVLGFVAPVSQVCIWLGFVECTHLGADFFEYCPVNRLIQREHIYLNVTIVLDIFTDVLIVSLPVFLLWNVKITLAKKLTLISVFGLSVVMIVIALIRVAVAPLTPEIIDTTWLFFWQIMEASIALIMVSISAFRGLFGQTNHRSAYARGRRHRGDGSGAHANGRVGAGAGGDRNLNADGEEKAKSSGPFSAFSPFRSGPRQELEILKKTTVTTTSTTNRSVSPANEHADIELEAVEPTGGRSQSRAGYRSPAIRSSVLEGDASDLIPPSSRHASVSPALQTLGSAPGGGMQDVSVPNGGGTCTTNAWSDNNNDSKRDRSSRWDQARMAWNERISTYGGSRSRSSSRENVTRSRRDGSRSRNLNGNRNRSMSGNRNRGGVVGRDRNDSTTSRTPGGHEITAAMATKPEEMF